MVITGLMHLPRRAVLFAAVSLLLLLQGCGPTARLTVQPDFKPPAEIETVYVVPFTGILVPEDFKEAAFNDFVDILNANRDRIGVRQFEIIKGELKDQDAQWLAKQLFISGEFWSYIENASCCNTELRVRGRVSLTEPGKTVPTFELTLPLDSFFEHDLSTLEKEKILLARRLARELADRIIPALSRKR